MQEDTEKTVYAEAGSKVSLEQEPEHQLKSQTGLEKQLQQQKHVENSNFFGLRLQ